MKKNTNNRVSVNEIIFIKGTDLRGAEINGSAVDLLPSIFKKNIKNNLKLRPFNDMTSDVGDIQYFPAWSKEWRNSVYHYNSNLIKNFPVYDINIVKIIKSCFYIYFNHQFLSYKHLINRHRRLSFNKIFFARPEIKHTNSKGIVTLYTFNREKFALSYKIKFVTYLIWNLSCLLRSGKGIYILKLILRKRIINPKWKEKSDIYRRALKYKLAKKYNKLFYFPFNIRTLKAHKRSKFIFSILKFKYNLRMRKIESLRSKLEIEYKDKLNSIGSIDRKPKLRRKIIKNLYYKFTKEFKSIYRDQMNNWKKAVYSILGCSKYQREYNLLKFWRYRGLKKKFYKELNKTLRYKITFLLKIKKWILDKPKLWKPWRELEGYLNKLEKLFFKFHFTLVLASAIFLKNNGGAPAKTKGVMKDINLLQDFYAYLSALKASKMKAKELANKWVKILWRGELTIIRKYKFKLNLNKYKFEGKFLVTLSNILSKIYSKQIEFNIVNLKNIVFNTDLFTEISTKKIQKKNTRVTKIMHTMLNKAKLPRVDRIKEKGRIVKNVNYNLLENKYRTLDLKNILSGKLHLDKLLNNTYLNYLNHSLNFSSSSLTGEESLVGNSKNKIYPLSLTKDISSHHIPSISFPKKKKSSGYYSVRKSRMNKLVREWWKNKLDFYTKSSSIYYVLYNLVFNSIKYKNMGGIRMEVKGRLTPRYRADRSVYKLRWKGGLKNIDSSYKGLSVRKNRGHLNPNVGYSIFSSKRRVGAFAVKGWMAGK